MYTPSPSQFPLIHRASLSKSGVASSGMIQTWHRPMEKTHTPLTKQWLYCSIRWTIVFVPLLLVLLAAFTHFQVHPAAFDLLSTDGGHDRTSWMKLVDFSLHEPHSVSSNRLVKRSTANRLAITNTTTPAPVVPVNPELPSPFPQPFDTTLSTNFTTTACYDFFLNMTQNESFLGCRPFSLLVATSYAFEEDQNNITTMNADVWGTCNTDIPQSQCEESISSFTSGLLLYCAPDLANQVTTVVTALNALRAYSLMRNASCQVDSATNAYCYIEAVANTDPSSYWFYQLPLGQPLGPDVTTSACNECTSTLMALYASALNDTDGMMTLPALEHTYDSAATQLDNVCGQSYAKAVQSSTSSASVNAGLPVRSSLAALGVLVLFAQVS